MFLKMDPVVLRLLITFLTQQKVLSFFIMKERKVVPTLFVLEMEQVK